MNAIAPPSGFPKNMLVIFLFIQAIMNGQTFFIVFYGGKFGLAEIDSDVLHQMILFLAPVFLQIRREQDNQLPWESICNQFKHQFQIPLMILNGGLLQIPWICFLLGPRNIAIEMPEGEIFAKYVSESNEHGIGHITIETRNTREIFDVSTDQITRFPTSDELRKSDEEFASRKDAEAATETSEAFNEQMRERSKNVGFPGIQRYYPNFSQETLRILFLLCRRFNIVPDFTYQFNLIVLRLLPLGDQSRFPLPQLSEEDQKDFEAFKQKYNTQMVGRVIKSKTGRFQESQASSLPDHLRRLFEYFCFLLEIESPSQEDVDKFLQKVDVYFEQLATNMSTKSGSALTFPDSYWTQPEFGVVLKNSKNTMLQSLFKMPSSFPPDVFV